MATKAQRWAQQRNFLKARLLGAKYVLTPNSSLVTGDEINELLAALDHVESILSHWDERNGLSKEKYLKEGR